MIPKGSHVVVAEGGAPVYRSRVRRAGWSIPAGTHGHVTDAIGNFRTLATGSGMGAGHGCHLDAVRCRASHIHSFLVHRSALEVVPRSA